MTERVRWRTNKNINYLLILNLTPMELYTQLGKFTDLGVWLGNTFTLYIYIYTHIYTTYTYKTITIEFMGQ